MRTFIGIEFNSELKEKLSGLQRLLKPDMAKGRWKHPDNFHLTLKFLGETKQPVLDNVLKGLVESCSRLEGFSLKPQKLGRFKGDEGLRVLWIGLAGEVEKLSRLQEEIECLTEDAGFSREKRLYTPHITLAQDLVPVSAFSVLEEKAQTIKLPEILVDRVHIFSSEQIRGRRVYSSIGQAMFGK